MAENTAGPITPTPPADPNGGTPVYTAPTTPETPPVTPPTVPETPTIPEETIAKMREDISKDVSGKVGEEVSKSVIQKIGEALGLTKKEENALPTDAEQLQKIIDKKVNDRFESMSQDATKQEEQQAQARQESIDNTIKGWHGQYNQLSTLGKVPAIKNPADVTDEGVVARRKLIMGIGKIIDENRKTDPSSNYVPSVSEVLLRFPDILKAPPGADLPISGNTASRINEDSYSYEKDIKGKSFEQIIDDNS